MKNNKNLKIALGVASVAFATFTIGKLLKDKRIGKVEFDGFDCPYCDKENCDNCYDESIYDEYEDLDNHFCEKNDCMCDKENCDCCAEKEEVTYTQILTETEKTEENVEEETTTEEVSELTKPVAEEVSELTTTKKESKSKHKKKVTEK